MKKIIIVALFTLVGIAATTTTSFARGFHDGGNFNNRGGYRNEGSFHNRDDHRIMERNRFYGNDRRFENRFHSGYGYNNYYNNGCRR